MEAAKNIYFHFYHFKILGKGVKLKKQKKDPDEISQEDLTFLLEKTKYVEHEIREWYRYKNAVNYLGEFCFYFRGFKFDCPSGELGRGKMEEMYGGFLPEGNVNIFVDQMFRVFDKDGNGSIDFKVVFHKASNEVFYV